MSKELQDKFFEFKMLSDPQFASEYAAFVVLSDNQKEEPFYFIGTKANFDKICDAISGWSSTFYLPISKIDEQYSQLMQNIRSVRGVTGISLDAHMFGGWILTVNYFGTETNHNRICEVLDKYAQSHEVEFTEQTASWKGHE